MVAWCDCVFLRAESINRQLQAEKELLFGKTPFSFSKIVPRIVHGLGFIGLDEAKSLREQIPETCLVRFDLNELDPCSWLVTVSSHEKKSLEKCFQEFRRWLKICQFRLIVSLLSQGGAELIVECDSNSPINAVLCDYRGLVMMCAHPEGGVEACAVQKIKPGLSRGGILVLDVDGEPCRSCQDFVHHKVLCASEGRKLRLRCRQMSSGTSLDFLLLPHLLESKLPPINNEEYFLHSTVAGSKATTTDSYFSLDSMLLTPEETNYGVSEREVGRSSGMTIHAKDRTGMDRKLVLQPLGKSQASLDKHDVKPDNDKHVVKKVALGQAFTGKAPPPTPKGECRKSHASNRHPKSDMCKTTPNISSSFLAPNTTWGADPQKPSSTQACNSNASACPDNCFSSTPVQFATEHSGKTQDGLDEYDEVVLNNQHLSVIRQNSVTVKDNANDAENLSKKSGGTEIHSSSAPANPKSYSSPFLAPDSLSSFLAPSGDSKLLQEDNASIMRCHWNAASTESVQNCEYAAGRNGIAVSDNVTGPENLQVLAEEEQRFIVVLKEKTMKTFLKTISQSKIPPLNVLERGREFLRTVSQICDQRLKAVLLKIFIWTKIIRSKAPSLARLLKIQVIVESMEMTFLSRGGIRRDEEVSVRCQLQGDFIQERSKAVCFKAKESNILPRQEFNFRADLHKKPKQCIEVHLQRANHTFPCKAVVVGKATFSVLTHLPMDPHGAKMLMNLSVDTQENSLASCQVKIRAHRRYDETAQQTQRKKLCQNLSDVIGWIQKFNEEKRDDSRSLLSILPDLSNCVLETAIKLADEKLTEKALVAGAIPTQAIIEMARKEAQLMDGFQRSRHSILQRFRVMSQKPSNSRKESYNKTKAFYKQNSNEY